MPVWRDAGTGDRGFLQQLDASLCGWLDAVAGLPDDQRRALVAMQSRGREQAYRAAWPQARCMVVELGEPGALQAVGRIWFARTPDALHLLDISLLSGCRGRGLGRACMEQLIGEAAAAGLAVTLEVAEDNPARRLYARLGFECVGQRPPHLQMRLDPAARPAGTGPRRLEAGKEHVHEEA